MRKLSRSFTVLAFNEVTGRHIGVVDDHTQRSIIDLSLEDDVVYQQAYLPFIATKRSQLFIHTHSIIYLTDHQILSIDVESFKVKQMIAIDKLFQEPYLDVAFLSDSNSVSLLYPKQIICIQLTNRYTSVWHEKKMVSKCSIKQPATRLAYIHRKLLVYGGDTSIYEFDFKKQSLVKQLMLDSVVNHIALETTGGRMILSFEDGCISVLPHNSRTPGKKLLVSNRPILMTTSCNNFEGSLSLVAAVDGDSTIHLSSFEHSNISVFNKLYVQSVSHLCSSPSYIVVNHQMAIEVDHHLEKIAAPFICKSIAAVDRCIKIADTAIVIVCQRKVFRYNLPTCSLTLIDKLDEESSDVQVLDHYVICIIKHKLFAFEVGEAKLLQKIELDGVHRLSRSAGSIIAMTADMTTAHIYSVVERSLALKQSVVLSHISTVASCSTDWLCSYSSINQQLQLYHLTRGFVNSVAIDPVRWIYVSTEKIFVAHLNCISVYSMSLQVIQVVHIGDPVDLLFVITGKIFVKDGHHLKTVDVARHSIESVLHLHPNESVINCYIDRLLIVRQTVDEDSKDLQLDVNQRYAINTSILVDEMASRSSGIDSDQLSKISSIFVDSHLSPAAAAAMSSACDDRLSIEYLHKQGLIDYAFASSNSRIDVHLKSFAFEYLDAVSSQRHHHMQEHIEDIYALRCKQLADHSISSEEAVSHMNDKKYVAIKKIDVAFNEDLYTYAQVIQSSGRESR
jgi:Tfp pilus assembly protein PilZ